MSKKTNKKKAAATRAQASGQSGAPVDETSKPAAAGAGSAKEGVGSKVAKSVIGVREGTQIPDEPVVLAVVEDRTRLILQAVGLLLLNIVMLFLAVGFFAATARTGNIVLLAGTIAALTVVWFVSRRMGRFFGKFFQKLDAIDFLEGHVVIYPTGDPKDALVVAYGDIKNYATVRQGHAVRLLLSGDWVKHPSGMQFVDINRPFMAGTLDEVEREIAEVMQGHHVKLHK